MSRPLNAEYGIKRYPGREHIVPLLPCPCCDGEADFCTIDNDSFLGWWAECTCCTMQCGDAIHFFASRLDLCNEWNSRVFRMEFIPGLANKISCDIVKMFFDKGYIRYPEVGDWDRTIMRDNVMKILLPHIDFRNSTELTRKLNGESDG